MWDDGKYRPLTEGEVRWAVFVVVPSFAALALAALVQMFHHGS